MSSKGGASKRKAETEAKQPRAKKAKVEVKEAKVNAPEPIKHAQIYVFGGGDTSQLTNQYPGEKKAPVPLENFTDVTVLDVQAAGYHTALLVEEKGKNKLITWGCNDDGVLGRVTEDEQEGDPTAVDLDDVVKIAVGDYHMCALTADGKLYGWGSYKDEEGFLGLQIGLSRKQRQKTPVAFDFPELEGVKIIDVVSSSNTTIVLTESGKIFQWGCTKQILPKKSTRLAESSDRDQLKPHSVFLSGKGKKLFSGGNHHFVIMENGTVQGWGINGYGQLGVGDEKPHERPRKVKGLSNVVSLSCGVAHTIALTEEGEVYSFGRNAYGQLGLGDAEEQEGVVERLPSKSTPQLISWFKDNLEKGEKVVQIYCGSHHSAAVTSADAYRLGTGSEDDQPQPKKLGGKWADKSLAKKVVCGTDFGVLVGVKKA